LHSIETVRRFKYPLRQLDPMISTHFATEISWSWSQPLNDSSQIDFNFVTLDPNWTGWVSNIGRTITNSSA
jgi:hypothetical protein